MFYILQLMIHIFWMTWRTLLEKIKTTGFIRYHPMRVHLHTRHYINHHYIVYSKLLSWIFHYLKLFYVNILGFNCVLFAWNINICTFCIFTFITFVWYYVLPRCCYISHIYRINKYPKIGKFSNILFNFMRSTLY